MRIIGRTESLLAFYVITETRNTRCHPMSLSIRHRHFKMNSAQKKLNNSRVHFHIRHIFCVAYCCCYLWLWSQSYIYEIFTEMQCNLLYIAPHSLLLFFFFLAWIRYHQLVRNNRANCLNTRNKTNETAKRNTPTQFFNLCILWRRIFRTFAALLLRLLLSLSNVRYIYAICSAPQRIAAYRCACLFTRHRHSFIIIYIQLNYTTEWP